MKATVSSEPTPLQRSEPAPSLVIPCQRRPPAAIHADMGGVGGAEHGDAIVQPAQAAPQRQVFQRRAHGGKATTRL